MRIPAVRILLLAAVVLIVLLGLLF